MDIMRNLIQAGSDSQAGGEFAVAVADAFLHLEERILAVAEELTEKLDKQIEAAHANVKEEIAKSAIENKKKAA